MARSNPFSLGVNAVKDTPGFRLIPAITSSPSAICGTHLELTKLADSILRIPLVDKRLTSFIFCGVLIKLLSFCRPSLGPISKIVTSNSIAHIPATPYQEPNDNQENTIIKAKCFPCCLDITML